MSQNSQNISPSAVSSPALPYFYDTIPQSGISQFVGRDKELETLHQLLQEHDQVAVTGISGIGKTELAIHYAKANLNHYTGGICWLFARSDLGVQIVEFSLLHFPNFTIPDKLTPTTQVQYCWQYWQSLLVSPSQQGNGEVLIIIDNLTDYSQIQSYLPLSSSGFKVLITTRLQLKQPVQMLSLDVLSPPAAWELLASHIGKYRVKDTRGKPFGIDSKRKPSKHKVKANRTSAFVPPLKGEGQGERLTVAQQLCELLGYLPLGIELVGRYLEQERNLSLEKMRSRLERASKNQLHLQQQHLNHESIIQPEANTDNNLTAQLSITAAFELSWKRLAQEAQELGCLLSIFASAPISWTQVESVYGQLYLPGALLGQLLNISPDNSQANIENLITTLLANLKVFRSQLIQLNLLQHRGEETYQLHPLIRELFQEKLESLEQSRNLKETFCQVMIAVAKQIPDSPSRDLIGAVTSAVPHITEAATTLQEFLSHEDLIQSLEGLAWFYQSQGFYDLATPWWEQCVWLTQNYLGSDHPDLVTNLHNLAWSYYAQERYTEAEPLSVQALDICEQKLGAEHPLTVATRKNLETLYLVLKK
ncbi:tetratricopeptide repeat protein [Allocoleopsis franciscana]|uniref:NB-ARC domain-containing protein n=1 Tax=Allocoleopsis franciscana PCC 7113 TaxID=1173027 RepID=K9WBV5_9CYAN|nr:tetratricopeptide repeat protein [Allocoleopsis franciscana]AFZ17244.1 hypothetical protein Mic7113_1360 [Allocoleopsis franciscana PCC 7113]